MKDYTKNLIKNKLYPLYPHIIAINNNLNDPESAFYHLISTTYSSIMQTINYVEEKKIHLYAELEYYYQINYLRHDIIENIYKKNIYNNNLRIPKFDSYDHALKECKYYQYAKETYKKVVSGKTPIVELNNDAFLAYTLYNIANIVINNAFEIKDKNLILSENSQIIKDYTEYNKEINNNIVKYLIDKYQISERYDDNAKPVVEEKSESNLEDENLDNNANTSNDDNIM